MNTRETYEPLPVVGGPMDGATFTPLFDVRPGQPVKLSRDRMMNYRYFARDRVFRAYRVSADGKSVVWEVV